MKISDIKYILSVYPETPARIIVYVNALMLDSDEIADEQMNELSALNFGRHLNLKRILNIYNLLSGDGLIKSPIEKDKNIAKLFDLKTSQLIRLRDLVHNLSITKHLNRHNLRKVFSIIKKKLPSVEQADITTFKPVFLAAVFYELFLIKEYGQSDYDKYCAAYNLNPLSVPQKAVQMLVNAMGHTSTGDREGVELARNEQCTSKDAYQFYRKILQDWDKLDEESLDMIAKSTIMRPSLTTQDALHGHLYVR